MRKFRRCYEITNNTVISQSDEEEPDELQQAKKNTMMNEDIEEKEKPKEETRVRSGSTCASNTTRVESSNLLFHHTIAIFEFDFWTCLKC